MTTPLLGYLGAVASALLVSCAVRRDPVESWGRTLTLRALPVARRLALDGPDAEREVEHWGQFVTVWERYLLERNIAEDTATTSATDTTASTASRAMFPESLGTPEGRDEAYRAWSLDGWAGRSGHDAPMIAYDAVLRAAPSMERRTSEGEPEGTAQGWELLCNYGMFHGGDSDSTGVIAGACWGALWGLEGVPVGNSEYLEYHDRLIHAADSLYRLAWPHTAAE
ncbi:ADP-ribosylhydrolase ARH1-like [Petromyzon marinus]|uniref:ADP-ribosylhydrolase ARH1-like n=1 Tax=Petromyzon marinus TaxID=7757 RepID=UPI003F70BD53